MCGFYCITLIEYIIAGKTLLDYTNLFSFNDYKKNDKIIYMAKENVILDFRLRRINEIRHYILVHDKLILCLANN